MYFFYRQGQKLQNTPAYFLPLLFTLKFGAGLFFLYVYTYIYGGGELTADAGAFFRESKILHSVYAHSPIDYLKYIFNIDLSPEFVDKHLRYTQHWNGTQKLLFNDSQNVLRVNSLLLFLSKGEVMTHILFMCAFSFWGVFECFKWVKHYTKIKEKHVLIILLLIPSVAFWSSSFIKEPLLILGVGLFLNSLFSKTNTRKIRILKFILGFLFILGFKPYVFLCFLPVLLYLIIQKIFKSKSITFNLGIFGLSLLIFFLIPNLRNKVVHKISDQQRDFINVGLGGLHLFRNDTIYFFEGVERGKMKQEDNLVYLLKETEGALVVDKKNYGLETVKISPDPEPWHVLHQSNGSASSFQVTRINRSALTLFTTLPEVLLNVLFRPFPGDDGSWLIYFAMSENILFALLFLGSLLFLRRKLNYKEKEVVIALFIFVLCLYLIIGYTTPVTGAIVRYKIPGVLAMACILCIFFDPKKQTK
ncbi:MAG: hypothetical protein ACPGU5_05825 [Lishizhenia sp.]